MANSEFTGVSCGDNYTDAATIRDVFGSGGGVFEVQNQPVKYKLQYGGQGVDYWTSEAVVGTGGGTIPPGVTGLAFRNAVAGQTAVVSALIRPAAQPHLALSFPAATVITGNMQLIATVTLATPSPGFGVAVPAVGGANLHGIVSVRSTAAVLLDSVLMSLNGDNGANYDTEEVFGAAAAAGAQNGLNVATPLIGRAPGTAVPAANAFGSIEFWIPNYLSAVSDKMIDATTGVLPGVAGSSVASKIATRWHPAVPVAVTSLVISPATGPNFAAGSTFNLYSY